MLTVLPTAGANFLALKFLAVGADCESQLKLPIKSLFSPDESFPNISFAAGTFLFVLETIRVIIRLNSCYCFLFYGYMIISISNNSQ